MLFVKHFGKGNKHRDKDDRHRHDDKVPDHHRCSQALDHHSGTQALDHQRSTQGLDHHGGTPNGYGSTGSSPVPACTCPDDTENPPEPGAVVTISPCDDPDPPQSESTEPVVQMYRERWCILLLFFIFSATNGFQYIHLNIIANIVNRHYNHSIPGTPAQQKVAIDWLCTMFLVVYALLVFPVIWVLEEKGLRVTGIIGAYLNALGAWVRCWAGSSFAVLMVAQTVCAVAQVFILGIPPQLAGVWFGPDEVSTATAIGLNAVMVGMSVGMLLPPVIVPDTADEVTVGRRLEIMFYTTAGLTTVVLILFYLFYKDGPPRPPSQAAQSRTGSFSGLRRSLLALFSNRNYVCMLLSYGINTGVFLTLTTKWNEIFLTYFKHKERDVGLTGLTMIIAGMGGSVLAGKWLDVTKLYRSTNLFLYELTFAAMIALTCSFLGKSIALVYVFSGIFGVVQISYQVTAAEFTSELTYPEPEGTALGILMAVGGLFGLLFTMSMDTVIQYTSVADANCIFCGLLFVGIMIAGGITFDLRRQKAEKTH